MINMADETKIIILKCPQHSTTVSFKATPPKRNSGLIIITIIQTISKRNTFSSARGGVVLTGVTSTHMDMSHWQINVVQQFIVVLDRVAG